MRDWIFELFKILNRPSVHVQRSQFLLSKSSFSSLPKPAHAYFFLADNPRLPLFNFPGCKFIFDCRLRHYITVRLGGILRKCSFKYKKSIREECSCLNFFLNIQFVEKFRASQCLENCSFVKFCFMKTIIWWLFSKTGFITLEHVPQHSPWSKLVQYWEWLILAMNVWTWTNMQSKFVLEILKR